MNVPKPIGRRWLRFIPPELRSRLAERSHLQLLIVNASWLVGDKVVRLGVGLLVNVAVGRYLGPQEFGALNYALALILLVSAVSAVGLPDIIVRDFVRQPEAIRNIAASAVVLRLGGSALALLFAIAIVIILRPASEQLVLMTLLIGSMLFPQALDTIDQFFQSRNDVRGIVVIRNVSFLLIAVLKIIAIVLTAPVTVFAALMSIEMALTAVLVWLYSTRRGFKFTLMEATWAETRRLLEQSWPLMLRLVSIGIYMRVDQVIMGRMLGDRAVGIYSAATRISEVWYFIPTAMMAAFVPRLIQHHTISNDLYERQLVKVVRYITAFSVLSALVLSFGARPIIVGLYGEAYSLAAPVLAIHAWSGVFVGIGVASSAWFVNNGLMRFGLYQAIIGAAVSLVLNLVLIPRFGVAGAASAAVVSYALSAVIVNACSASTWPIFRLQLRAIGFP